MPVYQSSITPIMKIQIIKAIIIGNIIDCQTPYDVGSSYKYAFKRGIEGHGFVTEWVNSLIEQVTQFAKFSFIYPFKNMSLSKEQGQTLPKFQY